MIEPCWRIVSLAGWLHKALPIPTGIPAFLMKLTWESSASQQRQLGTPKDKLREWTTNVVTVWATVIILFETTASALDSAQASLTPQLFWHLRVLCVRTQGFRRENGAWSRIQSRSRGFKRGLRQTFLLDFMSHSLYIHHHVNFLPMNKIHTTHAQLIHVQSEQNKCLHPKICSRYKKYVWKVSFLSVQVIFTSEHGTNIKNKKHI